MTPTTNLYLEYLYSRSTTARREFLDALATEETDAMVVNLRDFSRADGDFNAAGDVAGELTREQPDGL